MSYFKHGSYLPEHWKAWLLAFRPDRAGKLGAEDFPLHGEVKLTFGDGSTAHFKYAFCALDEERGELAVFTEHCRYHVFGTGDLGWEGPEASLARQNAKASEYPLVTRHP